MTDCKMHAEVKIVQTKTLNKKSVLMNNKKQKQKKFLKYSSNPK